MDDYRRGLITTELDTLQRQANLFAAALGESATDSNAAGVESINEREMNAMVRRLVEASGIRARFFGLDKQLVADSLMLLGPGGTVQVEELSPPRTGGEQVGTLLAVHDQILAQLWRPEAFPPYVEQPVETADDYQEVVGALGGEPGQMVRAAPDGSLVLSAAAPVKHYKHVLGAVMLIKGSSNIDSAVLGVRLEILKLFVIALGVTVLLSFYLAETIARPIHKLAGAAELVRRDRHERHQIPDFSNRKDEIAELSLALREMTEALWLRLDAIERFAADVAHELKNPLTSLRSAVETAARITDPERRQRLMNIILEDVSRLDRLITDISDASRLDAELSRATALPVDISRMLATLADVSETAAMQQKVRLRLELSQPADLFVEGIEGRLVQVFRNLIANALSFSPAGGTITLRGMRRNGSARIEILDEGPGIPEGREKDIFQRFYSARPLGEKFGVHSGLGLSISKQIVEAHGGTIHAENRRHPDNAVIGAKFVVELPVVVPLLLPKAQAPL